MIIDPIGDLLTRLRNAYLARILEVKAPYSRLKSDILKILKWKKKDDKRQDDQKEKLLL